MSRLKSAALAAAIGAACAIGAAPAHAAASSSTVWACRPGQLPDPCTETLNTTRVAVDGTKTVEDPPVRQDQDVDCFYVYPTVSEAITPNAPKSADAQVRAIERYQAGRFAQSCRVFAPVYRQQPLLGAAWGIIPTLQKSAMSVAYGDVATAFKEYLANDNGGRPFVLIGHSQGAVQIIKLLANEIAGNPDLRSRMLSAMILGGNPAVDAGTTSGGDLGDVPLCTEQGQIGCVIAYSSYNAQPSQRSVFGRANGLASKMFGLKTGPGLEIACTNPAELSGDGDALETYARTEGFPGLIGIALSAFYGFKPPRAATPWIQPQEHYTAHCEYSNGAHVLMVKALPGQRNPVASPAEIGLHLGDVNLAVGNLVKIVEQQDATYVAAHS